jgi:hypothetical protein
MRPGSGGIEAPVAGVSVTASGDGSVSLSARTTTSGSPSRSLSISRTLPRSLQPWLGFSSCTQPCEETGMKRTVSPLLSTGSW